MFDLMKARDDGPVTYAEPNQSDGVASTLSTISKFNPVEAIPRAHWSVAKNPEIFTEIFTSAERQQRLVDNVFARDRATEEAFDQRIAAVKTATGVELENPMRGGYAIDARKQIRDEVRANRLQTIDAKGGIPEYQQNIFEQRLEELRQKHPDKMGELTFGDLGTQAKDIARGTEEDTKKASAAATDPIASFGASVAGSLWAGRRDPLFLGSLFVGPVTAVGKSVLARVVDAGIRQGLFNAGVSALEQPVVQEWRREVGLKSGVEPALENIGMAFLFGAIPGAAFRGAHEAAKARPAIERVLAGHPEPGDAEIAAKAVGAGMEPHEVTAVRIGEEMQSADRALLPPAAKNVAPEVHDDMTAAALKFADDPINSPAPEALAALRSFDPRDAAARRNLSAEDYAQFRRGVIDENGEPFGVDDYSPPNQMDGHHDLRYGSLIDRIEAEQPKSQAEAVMAASRVMEEDGTKATVTRLRDDLERFGTPAGKTKIAESRISDADGEHSTVNISNDAGFVAGRVEGKFLRVTTSFVEENMRGRGVGLDLYEEAMDWAKSRGLALMSDKVLSEDAKHIYAALARRGYDVKSLDGGTRFEVRAAKTSAKDPMEKIPFVREDGTPVMLTRGQAAKIGERESNFAMLVRSCK